jgi:alpha-beta hydrolase superfamily lysophospholipase
MPFFDGVDGAVYYKAWRAADPRASLVLLHGFGEHSGMYHRLGNRLTAENIDLWALDEIGHGLTYGERGDAGSLDALVEHGARLLDLAAGDGARRPIFLIGHSLGTSVAATLVATRQPAVSGLILSATAFGPAMAAWCAHTPADQELALSIGDCATDPFYVDEMENDPLAFTSARHGTSVGTVIPASAAVLRQTPLPAELPILLVHGTRDPLVEVQDARAVAAELPNARLVEFDCLHDLLNDVEHRAVASTIVSFVESHAT